MNEESLNSNNKENLSKKLLICYKISNLPNNNLKLLSNYNEVSSILKSNHQKKLCFYIKKTTEIEIMRIYE